MYCQLLCTHMHAAQMPWKFPEAFFTPPFPPRWRLLLKIAPNHNESLTATCHGCLQVCCCSCVTNRVTGLSVAQNRLGLLSGQRSRKGSWTSALLSPLDLSLTYHSPAPPTHPSPLDPSFQPITITISPPPSSPPSCLTKSPRKAVRQGRGESSPETLRLALSRTAHQDAALRAAHPQSWRALVSLP